MKTEQELRSRIAELEERVAYLEGVHRYTLDSLELAASLGDFQKSFSTAETPAGILRETCVRVRQLITFRWAAIFLFSEDDGSLNLGYRDPVDFDEEIEAQLTRLIEDRTLAWGLDRRQPIFIGPTPDGTHLLLHTIATSQRIRGVFLGLLLDNVYELPESISSLLPIIMLHSANSLENFELYRMIKTVNKELEQELTRRMVSEDALKEAHGQLRSIFDAAPVAIHFLDRNYKIVDVSEKYLSRFGNLTRAQVIGRKCYEVFRSRREPCPECLISRVVASGRTMSSFSINGKDPEAVSHYKMYCAPVKDADGQIRGIAVCLVDISDLKHMEKELKAAKEQAETASQAKSAFLASMSHEIRTPMNAITGMADMAILSGLSEEQRDYIETIKHSAQHLLQIINDILDFSKIEARMLRIERVDFDLHALLRTVVKALTPEAEKKTLALSLRCARDLPSGVKGDPVRLRQILYNLIGNALKFTPRGEIEVSACVVSVEGDTGSHRLLFSVRDTGIGIPADKQESVFKEFTQIRGPLGGRSGGTGLGLAICRQLVSLMDGAIWLESELGRGSTFFFSIPLERGELFLPSEEAEQDTGMLSRMLRILLVEDNPINAKVARLLLQRLGHTPCHVENGLEALKQLRRETFDVVLMDLEMPGLDGLATTKAIRNGQAGEDNRSLRIVAMTAHAISGYAQRCREAGMDGFIPKPVNIVTLRSELGVGPDWQNHEALQPQEGGSCPLLNVESALARLDGEREILQVLFDSFAQELPQQMAELMFAVRTSNRDLLGLRSHALKGGFSTIGAESCALICHKLEEASEAEPMDVSAALIRKLENEAARLLEALKKF